MPLISISIRTVAREATELLRVGPESEALKKLCRDLEPCYTDDLPSVVQTEATTTALSALFGAVVDAPKSSLFLTNASCELANEATNQRVKTIVV